jgi:hypothetical protein
MREAPLKVGIMIDAVVAVIEIPPVVSGVGSCLESLMKSS